MPGSPHAKDRWAKGSLGALVIGGILAAGPLSGLDGGTDPGPDLPTGTDGLVGGGRTFTPEPPKPRDPPDKGDHAQAWHRMGLTQLKRAIVKDLPCAPNSYGKVREFFKRSPCTSLDRVLLTLEDTSANTVVVSIAWITLPTPRLARDLRKLTDQHGTGNITPLPMSLIDATGATFTGRYYDSRLTGSTLVVAEVEPLLGHPDPDFMDALAGVASQFPPP